MDFSQIMQMAQQMRAQLESAQGQAQQMRIAAEAGGGLVRVVMNGSYEVVELKIDPAAVDPKDVVMLEDLVRAGVNQAVAAVAATLRDRVGGMVKGLGIELDDLGLGGNRPHV